MINYIYVLKIGGIPFYIGVTTDLKMRLSEHKVSFGKDIEIEKIDEHLGSTATAHSLEQFWIRKYLENGIVLKNKPPKSTVETNCLYCDAVTIQSSGKREKKFCSTSCRVMWNRNPKNKKEKGLTELQQMKVMYNALMDKIDKIALPSINVPLFDRKTTFDGIMPSVSEKPKIRRSFEYYQQARIDCMDIEEWAALKAQIMADDFLTPKQKNLLTING